jgi:HSP20 family protein
VLTLQGQRKGKDHSRKVHRIERDHGRFGRSFALPNLVDDAHVKAEFRNGVLHLVLPKSEKAKPKAIEVQVA